RQHLVVPAGFLSGSTAEPGTTDDPLEALVVGLVLGSFTFGWHRDGPPVRPVRRVTLVAPGLSQATVDRALAVGLAGWRARALAATPSNIKTPAWLADQAVAIAQGAGLASRVWDADELESAGFGGLVAVGRASAAPPRLIQLDYRPPAARRRTPHVVLVGKAITFDSGGLMIKPADNMRTMKRDMTGGGVVLAVMAALADVGCPVRVTGLVPAAENAVGGNAMRPGDVVRHYGGRTTEVTNTDAEGRLVLADAMAYAVAELAPDALVDIATLTGAVRVALGQRTGGLFANDEALASAISEAGQAAGEPLWRLPLASEYDEKVVSKVADLDNGAGNPGAITAALFLQHFAGNVPWAHLDVASTGDSPAEHFEWNEGPTGYGARALLAWLSRATPLEGVGG
ncbi:MAG TPA: leucyl aminopeptidase family protein, partial [Acidimicrobiales bacterium]|nr:leucyl aminopeptidase family protein [Acidimicrobiales bacterium]